MVRMAFPGLDASPGPMMIAGRGFRNPLVLHLAFVLAVRGTTPTISRPTKPTMAPAGVSATTAQTAAARSTDVSTVVGIVRVVILAVVPSGRRQRQKAGQYDLDGGTSQKSSH